MEADNVPADPRDEGRACEAASKINRRHFSVHPVTGTALTLVLYLFDSREELKQRDKQEVVQGYECGSRDGSCRDSEPGTSPNCFVM